MPDSSAWQDICRWEFATERDVEEDLDEGDDDDHDDDEVSRVLSQDVNLSALAAAAASSTADRYRSDIIAELRTRQRMNEVAELENRERKSIERIDTDDEEEDEDLDSSATNSIRSEEEVVQRDRDNRIITLRSSTTGISKI